MFKQMHLYAKHVAAMDQFDFLNPEQKEAATFAQGPLLVLAGAGSGKTRVVTTRIVNLIQSGVDPSHILAVTFTNKAAQEMKERVNRLTQSHVLICTFHSLGVRILRESIHVLGYQRDFTIYDEDDAEKLLKLCIEELGITDKKCEPKSFKYLISKAKNEFLQPDQVDPSKLGDKDKVSEWLPKVYSLYQQKLKEYNALDFDDLLFLAVILLQKHPDVLHWYQQRWSYLLIDEYQDTNPLQYTLARLLTDQHGNLFVVGDPDQSIYSWRGADIKNILNFEKDFAGAKVIRLEQNYRSTNHILNAANALIRRNESRYEKNLWSNLGDGEKIKLYHSDTEKGEVYYVVQQIRKHHFEEQIPLNEIAIFYRTNFQSRVFEDILLQNRLPYVIVGGLSFYQRKEIKDILAFLRVIHSGVDFISFARTINLPKRGIGESTLEKLRMGASESHLSLFEYCLELVESRNPISSIKLSTKQREGLKDYITILRELRELQHKVRLSDLIKSTIEKTRYVEILKDDDETFDDRNQNIQELISKAKEWEDSYDQPTLATFLEELSLKTTLDETDPTKERLNLMTIHNSKGLEYQVVFLVGMEEDLFPHANSRNGGPAALEEERRLCYVGLTRARKYLYLTLCRSRYLWGSSRFMLPSRFLKEIPEKYVEKVGGALTSYASSSYYKPSNKENFHIKEDFQEDFLDEIDQTQKEELVVEGRVERERVSVQEKALIQEEAFAAGDAIYHPQLGVGVIQRSYSSSVGLTYEILFSKDHLKRSIVAKYAKLTKL